MSILVTQQANTPASNCASTLLALFANPSVPCTKTFGINGKISDYPNDCYYWDAEQCLVSSVEELAEAVEWYSRFDNAIICRGILSAYGEQEIDNNRLITRRKAAYGDVRPPIEESTHRWCMLDLDDVRLRPCDDLATDPEIAIEHAIYSMLPPAFHDVRCFWQLSASAGFTPNVLKAHLWYWLSEPTDNLSMRKCMVSFVDVAPFNCCNQPHYIVPPVCQGINDPIPRRSGWIDGMADEVDVSAIPQPSFAYLPPSFGGTSTGNAVEDLQAILATIGDGRLRFHIPLRDACHAYAKAHFNRQVNGTHEDFKNLLRDIIEDAPKSTERDPSSITRYKSDKYLDDLIQSSERKLIANDPYTRLRVRLRNNI